MNTYTNQQILDKFKTLWPESDINLESNSREEIRVEVSKQYDAPGLGFKTLLEIGKFFGTMNVDTENDINQPGCETCDYGSAYGFTLYIKPE